MDNLLNLAAFLVSGAALAVAVVALRRSDRNASAATLVALYEALRAAWARYLGARKADEADFEFAELVNLIELACAVHLDKAVHGAMREMLEEYLVEVLEILRDDAGARARISQLKERPNTFKYLKRFFRDAGAQNKLGPLADLASDLERVGQGALRNNPA